MLTKKTMLLTFECDFCEATVEDVTERPKEWSVVVPPHYPDLTSPEEHDACAACTEALTNTVEHLKARDHDQAKDIISKQSAEIYKLRDVEKTNKGLLKQLAELRAKLEESEALTGQLRSQFDSMTSDSEPTAG